MNVHSFERVHTRKMQRREKFAQNRSRPRPGTAEVYEIFLRTRIPNTWGGRGGIALCFLSLCPHRHERTPLPGEISRAPFLTKFYVVHIIQLKSLRLCRLVCCCCLLLSRIFSLFKSVASSWPYEQQQYQQQLHYQRADSYNKKITIIAIIIVTKILSRSFFPRRKKKRKKKKQNS